MSPYFAGYVTAIVALASAAGFLATYAMRRSAAALTGSEARRRRRLAPVAGLLAALVVLAAPAMAQDGPVWSDEAVENLRGFTRGFSQSCAENCDATGGGQACALQCTCLVGEIVLGIDPATLEADGKALPEQDDIAAFFEANADAVRGAFETCGAPPG